MSVVVTDRHNSYFDIRLTVCDNPENMVGTYKCEAGSRLGMDTETYSVEGKNATFFLYNNYYNYIIFPIQVCSSSATRTRLWLARQCLAAAPAISGLLVLPGPAVQDLLVLVPDL